MGKTAKAKSLDYKGKVRLLRSWLHYLYEETESWQPDNIGMHVAYLCKAVIHDNRVQWTKNNPVLRLILKKDPARRAGIWKFIEVVSHDR